MNNNVRAFDRKNMEIHKTALIGGSYSLMIMHKKGVLRTKNFYELYSSLLRLLIIANTVFCLHKLMANQRPVF